MQVSDAIDDYLETLRCTRRPRTLEAATQILGEFGAHFGSHKLTDLTRRDLLTYLERLGKGSDGNPGNSKRTLANKYIRICAMLAHHNIKLTKKGDRPTFTRRLPQVYNDADLETFFAACDARQRVFFKTLLMTGLRMSEAKFLEWGDLQNQMLLVQAHPPHFTPKTHEERRIPVPSALWKMLSRMPRRPGKLVFPTKSGAPDRHMLRHCKRIAAKAGFNEDDWGLHKFRKTFCTSLLRSGMDLRTVMSLMGHSNIQTTLRYLQPIESEQLRGRVENIWGGTLGIAQEEPKPFAALQLTPAPIGPPLPLSTCEDFTNGVIFYGEPEPPEHNGNGNGTHLRDILRPADFEIVRGIVETGGDYAQVARNRGTTQQVIRNRVSVLLSRTGCRSGLQLAVRYAKENVAELRAAAGVARTNEGELANPRAPQAPLRQNVAPPRL